jgi:hypothetical protein
MRKRKGRDLAKRGDGAVWFILFSATPFVFGAEGETRTLNPPLTKRVLYR